VNNVDLPIAAAVVRRAERLLRPVDYRAPVFQLIEARDATFRGLHIVGPSGRTSRGINRTKKKLTRAQPVSREEVEQLLKAIRALRPAVAIQDGTVPMIDKELQDSFPAWSEFRSKVANYVESVARLDHDKPLATAFLVAPSLLMTNRHVASKLRDGTGPLPKGSLTAQFGSQAPTVVDTGRKPVTEVLAVHRDVDLALLRVQDHISSVIPFDLEVPEKAGTVAAIGFPIQEDQAPGFNDMFLPEGFGIKRVSPGEMTRVFVRACWHDCTTVGGSSGSPIFSLSSGKIIGVHREGKFLKTNKAVVGPTAAEFVKQYA
jgi:hypothetical protein